jgi:type I restriction enzyme R subunit
LCRSSKPPAGTTTRTASTSKSPLPTGVLSPSASKVKRGKQKRADYMLRYTRDLPLAVVEAKADYKQPGDGMQQAKEYAEMLDVKFAYASNGAGIVEFDF